MLRAVCLLGLLALPGLARGAPCTPIRFAKGHSSAVITGKAPVDDVVCYTLATGAGQHARLKILTGANTVFSIDGLVDAQDNYSFTTAHKSYEITVGQLNRATEAEAFSLEVGVK